MSTNAVPHTSAEYIQHHMTNWQLNLHNFTFTNGGFWTVDLDTILVSVLLGALFLIFFHSVARKMTTGTPTKLGNVVEMSIEAVEKVVKESVRNDRHFIAPLALTIFIWTFLMNFMDLVPVDLIPQLMKLFGVTYFRAVPTTNPMLTFAMSLTVFALILYYNVKSKGPIGLSKEVLSKPFGWYLFPVNILFRLIEECVKPVSLSLRLFGNIFAGEIVFLLIAMMPWWGQLSLGFIWTMFHLLVITIQAFIFMMLTIVYLGMAQESH